MMETKLWIALCALLVINLGTAQQNGDLSAGSPTPESAPNAQPVDAPSVAEPTPSSSPNLTASDTLNSSDADPSPNVTSSLSGNKTTKNETITGMSKPVEDHAIYNITHPEAAGPEMNKSTANQPAQPTHPSLENFFATSHITPSSTSASTTITAHTSPTTAAAPNHSTSHQATTLPAVSPNQLSQNKTQKTEPPQTTAHTTASTQSSSTAATIRSSHENSTSQLTANNSQSHGQPEASSEVSSKSSTTPTSIPSTQAKTHSDTPSQLNVEGDTTMVHDSPALDPLLAGLVSAFIITAVIITLLLFLKLRRRDNRPEFRRLQDLPMDDMMEDTPLSMYSY